jgi:hypothetical protein
MPPQAFECPQQPRCERIIQIGEEVLRVHQLTASVVLAPGVLGQILALSLEADRLIAQAPKAETACLNCPRFAAPKQ